MGFGADVNGECTTAPETTHLLHAGLPPAQSYVTGVEVDVPNFIKLDGFQLNFCLRCIDGSTLQSSWILMVMQGCVRPSNWSPAACLILYVYYMYSTNANCMHHVYGETLQAQPHGLGPPIPKVSCQCSTICSAMVSSPDCRWQCKLNHVSVAPEPKSIRVYAFASTFVQPDGSEVSNSPGISTL